MENPSKPGEDVAQSVPKATSTRAGERGLISAVAILGKSYFLKKEFRYSWHSTELQPSELVAFCQKSTISAYHVLGVGDDGAKFIAKGVKPFAVL